MRVLFVDESAGLLYCSYLFLEVPLLLVTFCACSSLPVTHQLGSEELRGCREQALMIMKWYLPFADEETHGRNVIKTCIVSIGQDKDVEE
jgi:hypothetical protein